MKKGILLSTLMCVFAYFGATAQDKVMTHTLSNGMEVWLNEDHSAPSVIGMVVVKAGAKDCPDTGIAHYFEHMMFKGTDKIGSVNYELEKPILDSISEQYKLLKATTDVVERKAIQIKINDLSVEAAKYAVPNEFSNLTTLFGGSMLNAGTSYDYTIYFNLFSSNNIEPWLELNSERLLNPVFRLFQSELETVYEEKNMYSDMMGMAAMDRALEALFAPHPYSKPVIGSTENLKNPDLDAMMDFYDKYYVAGNMGLMLSGDFNTEEVLPLVEKYFSRVKAGEAPVKEYQMPREFNGRETHTLKIPVPLVKLGANVWRTVPQNHPDEFALNIACGLLNNSNSTGYLDRLSKDRKVIAAAMINMGLTDAGVALAFYVPKYIIFGLKGAEKRVLASIDKIKKGDFTDEEFNAVKMDYLKSHLLRMENKQNRATTMATVYSSGLSWDDYLAHQQKINDITKEEVVAVMNKYIGDDKLVITKKSGDYAKDNLEKPGFDPIIPQTEVKKSDYAKEVIEKHMHITPPRFIDMNKDVSIGELPSGERIITSNNPYNDIFTLKLSFGVGSDIMPSAPYLAEYLNYLGTGEMTDIELRNKFRSLGSTIYFDAESDRFNIRLMGYDKNLKESWELLKHLMYSAVDNKKGIKQLLNFKKMEEKFSDKDAGYLDDALLEYILYGDNSSILRDMSYKELKRYPKGQLLKDFDNIISHNANIFYAGTMSFDEITSILGDGVRNGENKEAERAYFPLVNYEDQEVYLINTPKSRQSKISAVMNVGELTDLKERALAQLVNMYIGGGMNSILFRELREYRSYAYSAGSMIRIPKLYEKDHTGVFICGMTTQSDKTIEAMSTMDSLVRNVAFTPEYFEQAKVQMINDISNYYPDFRNMPNAVSEMLAQGFNEDSRREFYDIIKDITISDLQEFYEARVKNNHFVICVATDTKRLKPANFEKFGKTTELKKKDITK